MSAIGCIFNFHRRPFDRDDDLRDLAALWHALRRWGPDGGHVVISGPAGFCYQGFHTNRESLLERQPVAAADGRVLAADIRIDNRAEVFEAIHDVASIARSGTDSEYAMASQQQWGRMFPRHIVGEYAMIVYEPRSRSLRLYRDHVGARPLYYHVARDRLIVSSQLAPLIDLFGISRDLNEEYIGGCMSRGPIVGLTPYKHIHAVKPAHVLTVAQDGRLTEERYWQLDPGKEIRLRNDEEYEEAFRHHLWQAVQAPLRSDRPVMIELSGGLDSSTIACVADRVVREGGSQTSRLETVSYVYDESPTSDERKFIQCVESHRGRRGIYVRDEDCTLLPPPEQELDVVTPNPVLYAFGYHAALCELMSETGARVLLTGVGGDQVLGSSYDPYPELADLLVLREPVALHRRLRLWSETLNKPYLSLLWQKTVVPTLPRSMQPWCRPSIAKRVPSWFNAAFLARARVREQELPPADPFGFRLPSGRDRSVSYLSVIKNVSPCHRRELTCLDSAYPFMHRPLVEFLQAIPFAQLLRPGENRSLMRRALRDVLPEKIARRKTKGSPNEGLYRAIAREWPMLRALFADARVCAYGFMDSASLLAAVDRAKHGLELFVGALFATVSLEFWLRALETRPAARKHTAVEALPQLTVV